MSTLQAIVTALDEQLTLTDEEKSVVYSARLFDMEYQQRGTKHLYTVADLVPMLPLSWKFQNHGRTVCLECQFESIPSWC